MNSIKFYIKRCFSRLIPNYLEIILCFCALIFHLIPHPAFSAPGGNGRISGRVLNEQGLPISDVTVRATVFEGPHRRKDGTSDSNGFYQITGLESENYVLRTYNTKGYVDEFYLNAFTHDSAEIIKINDNATVTNIDFVLGTGGFISGQAVDADSDAPLPRIEIIFLDKINREVNGLSITDADGRFLSPALRPGEYLLKAFGANQGYISLYWPNVENLSEAIPVPVQLNQTNENRNFRLQMGGQISGHIYSQETQAGVDSVWVVVLDSTEAWISQAWSKNGGQYEARGLKSGKYKVWIYEVDPWKYRAEYYQDSENFAQAAWVSVNLPQITSGIDFYLNPVHNAIVRNEILEIAVADKFPGTNLTIGTTGGLDTPLDDNQSLLNGHPRPVMSYTTVRIDGKDFRFSSNSGSSLCLPTVSPDGRSITRSWKVENVAVTQIAGIVSSTWSHLRRDDTAKLEYLIYNDDSRAHEVGLRILFDTKLGETDGAPIDIPYYGPSNFEREFGIENMPPWWTAKNVENGQIIFSAQGTLKDYNAVAPDKFVIARYEKIMPHKWDYQIDPNQEYLKDSAVAMWWFPRVLEPGDSLRICTYYGLGEDTPDLEAPQILSYLPEKDAINVHPDSSIRLVIEDRKSGIDTSSIQIFVNGFEADWWFTGTLKEMTLHVEPKQPFHLNQHVRVNLKHLQDLAPVPNSIQPEDYYFDTIVDVTAPELVKMFPAPGDTGVSVDTTIYLWLEDSPAGIDTNSILMRVNGDTVKPVLVGNEQRFELSCKPPTRFDYSAKVIVELSVCDLSTPPNCTPKWLGGEFFTIDPVNKDSLAPTFSNLRPAPDTREVQRQPWIEATIKDNYAGVEKDSIIMFVNSGQVIPQITGNSMEYQVRYLPGKHFKYSQPVEVILFAADKITTPNKAAITWNFAVKIDTTAPWITERYPNENIPQVHLDPEIQFLLREDLSGVNTDSIKVWVDGITRPFTLSGDSLKCRVTIKLAQKLNYNQLVRVAVSARDLAYSPNVMDTVEWCFTTIAYDDSIPPYTLDHFPAADQEGVDLNSEICFKIFDNESGVDSTSIRVIVDNQEQFPEIRRLDNSLKKFQICLTPEKPFHYNQKVFVNISAADFFGNELKDSFYYFSTLEDKKPPEIYDRLPAPGTLNVPPNILPEFNIRDDVSDVNLNSVKVLINGELVAAEFVSLASLTYRVRCPGPKSFELGETVHVMICASDYALNSIDSLGYRYKISESRPDLEVVALTTDPAREVKMNVPFCLVTAICSKNTDIPVPFSVTFYQLNEIILDTLVQKIWADSVIEIRHRCHYPKGEYKFKVVVDSKDVIQEINELNNTAEIVVKIGEGQGRVAPNPFTPNNDGFNDEIKFDFTQLDLVSPELKLFNFQAQHLRTLPAVNNGLFSWNGQDQNGRALPPGIYLYILTDQSKTLAKGSVILAR